MGLTWRDTLEGHFCSKLVFLKVIKLRGYICNFFSLFAPFIRITINYIWWELSLHFYGLERVVFSKLFLH